MKFVKEQAFSPIKIGEADSIAVKYVDKTGKEHQLIDKAQIGPCVVDYIKIFQLDNGDFGMKAGFAAVLGEKL